MYALSKNQYRKVGQCLQIESTWTYNRLLGRMPALIFGNLSAERSGRQFTGNVVFHAHRKGVT
jgi:hypothetical protein